MCPFEIIILCPFVSFRFVLVELVSDGLLPLQPRPHPLLQGVLRPSLPGRLRLGVTPSGSQDTRLNEHSCTIRAEKGDTWTGDRGQGTVDSRRSTLFSGVIFWDAQLYIRVTAVMD